MERKERNNVKIITALVQLTEWMRGVKIKNKKSKLTEIYI